ncbi:YdeI/OmpD-associated family protein [Pseudoduganella chitinolytica]|uniref:YdeI/OmpD-associated family protein n=1 Tax=Pseudoduganella chitinolytica TaxID=34070 RepID=A0ABY8B9C6_9BURK|nr:YdeI/OmpD-associated family protein [Pseudoduganella chitinolytica]WEF32033.1 YdeI/OmpD-associated family protein [Pseudoduganella chitinolytica]
MPVAPKAQLPELSFADAAAWEAWLAREHARAPGAWLRIAKRGAGANTVQYPAALEVALCYGWIDGIKRRIDDDYWVQKFTPRAARSIWSKVNRDKVQALIDSGRMRPAGLKEIERARADGRWDAAYDSVSQATVPPGLQMALEANPAAQAFFATLDSRNRYAILHRLQTAKKPETRARRLEQFVQMLARGEKLHP